jgi:hypothetical protein
LRHVSLLLAGLAAVCVALAAWLGSELSLAGHSDDALPRQIVIGNDVLSVPGNVIRFRDQRREPTATRLDLYFHWPSLSGYSEALDAHFSSQTADASILFVTLEPRQMTLEMSGRLGPLYGKFMTGERFAAGHGLIRAPLSEAAGFVGEAVWYEADSPYPFVARCVGPESGATPYCMRDFHIGRGLSATYRFHQSLIPDWRRLDAAVRQRLKSMLVE